MNKLYKVVDLDTREVHNVFAKSEKSAIKQCRLYDGDHINVEEVKAYNREGSYPVYLLKDIPFDTFFRYANCNSLKVGNKTYIKRRDDYDRSTKKYCCMNWEDVNDWREFKPTQWVVIDFTY